MHLVGAVCMGPWAAPPLTGAPCCVLLPRGGQVPRSTRLITEDNDYALMSAVVFKRVAEDFKTAARLRGFQVRVAPGF